MHVPFATQLPSKRDTEQKKRGAGFLVTNVANEDDSVVKVSKTYCKVDHSVALAHVGRWFNAVFVGLEQQFIIDVRFLRGFKFVNTH